MHSSREITEGKFLYDHLNKTWYFMIFFKFSENPKFLMSLNLQTL